eukprot:333119_1
MLITKIFILISLLSLLTNVVCGCKCSKLSCMAPKCWGDPPQRRRAIGIQSDLVHDKTNTQITHPTKVYYSAAIIKFYNDMKAVGLAENEGDITKLDKYMNNFSNDIKYCTESICYNKNQFKIKWNGKYKSIDFDIYIMAETYNYVQIQAIAKTISTQECHSTMMETVQISFDNDYKIKQYNILSREDEDDPNTCNEDEEEDEDDANSFSIIFDSKKRLLSETSASNIECYSCSVESPCPYSGKQNGQQCKCYMPTHIKVSSNPNCASMNGFDGVSVAWWCDDRDANCLSCE